MLQVYLQRFVPDSKMLQVHVHFCTMHLITYPDVVYKVATDAILIQTRCVQSVVSLEKNVS